MLAQQNQTTEKKDLLRKLIENINDNIEPNIVPKTENQIVDLPAAHHNIQHANSSNRYRKSPLNQFNTDNRLKILAKEQSSIGNYISFEILIILRQ